CGRERMASARTLSKKRSTSALTIAFLCAKSVTGEVIGGRRLLSLDAGTGGTRLAESVFAGKLTRALESSHAHDPDCRCGAGPDDRRGFRPDVHHTECSGPPGTGRDHRPRPGAKDAGDQSADPGRRLQD